MKLNKKAYKKKITLAFKIFENKTVRNQQHQVMRPTFLIFLNKGIIV